MNCSKHIPLWYTCIFIMPYVMGMSGFSLLLSFFQKAETHTHKKDSVLKHTDLFGCTLCGMLHRCKSQKQYHWGENKRVVCYVSVSLVLLPVMHNECPRHALSIESKYKPTRVSLTWLPGLGPNSICVKASVPLLCLQLGSKP